ncbi:MAG: thiamine pyrophosphate-binding protein [Deinococcota bacterium]|jgi:acetolactate synthase-1/2/3 large subunit|nr:thiamine pyrophosphate-binding protein [Deinococcota bacterium]MDQ3458980.1 thiamine pyrophosphate-binding protein [Deinococcota bacterium]
MTVPQAERVVRSGGRVLVDALRVQGVDTVFSVAGESYLEVLDALYDVRESVRLITCRQEGGAAFMAEAYGKLTGRPGICVVTRGPGACNASIAVHTARQDSTPMLLLVGQVGRGHAEREAFQEIDYRQMFGSVAKWVTQVNQAERIPEALSRAFHVAMSGRPGPVVLALPEDMLRDEVGVADSGPCEAVRAHPSAADLECLQEMLEQAERPLMLVGGSTWTDEACRQITTFAEANDLPVLCAFRRQDVVPNDSSSYVGALGVGAAPTLLKRLKEADLLLVVGARLSEMNTQGYALLESPEPQLTLIHAHPEAEELGRVYHPALAIQSGVSQLAAALQPIKVDGKRWREWREGARGDYESTLKPPGYEGELDLGEVLLFLRQRLPEDAIVTIDAGNFSGWPQRFLRFGRPGRQLGPTSGAMGYSVPAAVSASLTCPDRLVVSFVGDGGFLMTGQELATALQHGCRPVILVFNNNMYGTIRMHQEMRYPDRVIGTDLTNPDFAAVAAAYGAHAETVLRTEEFAPAFERAVASGKAAVIELRTDPEVISTRSTLSAMRASSKGGTE